MPILSHFIPKPFHMYQMVIQILSLDFIFRSNKISDFSAYSMQVKVMQLCRSIRSRKLINQSSWIDCLLYANLQLYMSTTPNSQILWKFVFSVHIIRSTVAVNKPHRILRTANRSLIRFGRPLAEKANTSVTSQLQRFTKSLCRTHLSWRLGGIYICLYFPNP